MVRYDRLAQTAPAPADSNSDSHRGEFVGRSNGGNNIVMMRCSTRGERSEVAMKNSSADEVAAEVDAMGQVARALAALPDAQSRARVLRWVMDRYRVDATPIAAPAVQAPPALTGLDPTLEVESLDDLFPAARRTETDEEDLLIGEPARPAQGSGIESMIRGFAADFRRFALEWQGT
jgi:phage terminase large subunit-like protein